MGTDFDPLDEIFADEAVKKNARAGGKFQPKAKFRPTTKESVATSVSTSQAVQTTDSTQSELSEPVGTAKPSENLISGSDVVPNDNGGWQTFMEKSFGENSELFIGLEVLGDFPPHTSNDMACTLPSSEAVAPNAANPGDAGEQAIPVHSSVKDSTDTCNVADVLTYSGLSEDIDSFTAGEPIVPRSDGSDRVHDRELVGEETDAMDYENMTELITNSVHGKGKFQPKSKIKLHKETRVASESVSSLGSLSVPPEINYAEKDSNPSFQEDDVLDLSSLDFTHTLQTEATSDVPSNEEPLNLMEMTELDSGIHLEGVPEIITKLASRRAKIGSSNTHTASGPSPEQQEASPSSHENETGRSLRPRKSKTNIFELVDEDEILTSVEFSEECPPGTAVEKETINIEELQVESESQVKKSKRKSKNIDGDKEKPIRNRKKTKEASDKDAGAKPKKFSHSTRRRRVDKVLLETPEDEIDYQKVPLRDLIMLAEHKERQMKIDEAAAGAPVTKQSNGNSSGHYNEDETFGSKQGGEYNDEQGSPIAEDTTEYFNYQTYMDKTPSIRWSKQDTELFYEAVRQFGTDLSLIQQLFPGRTRRQVKLKYKKEERQHPMRLRDALTNRTKDHSHFEQVIEHLKKIAAEEEQSADKDDPIDLTGNEVADEGTSNADDEEPKGEHIQEEETNDAANDVVDVQSPLKSDDGEDDLFMWSQYKSDT